MDKTQMYAGVEVYRKPGTGRGRPHKMVKLPNGVCMGYKRYEASWRKARKAERKAAKVAKPTATETPAVPQSGETAATAQA